MPHDVLCLRPRADFARADALPPDSFTVAYHAPDDPQLAALVRAAQAVVMPAVGAKLSPQLFEGSRPGLKLIQVTGAGVDRLDEPAMKKLGIPVANVPGGSNSAVAEYAVTAASVLLRRFAWADAEIKRGNYTAFRAKMLTDNLAGLDGLTVGLVGMGVIGLAVAKAFHNAGCRICYFDPAPRDAAAALGAQPMALEELLKASDVVSLHLPLLPATTGLIGDRQLASMKPGAILVQGSRGGIVDEAALAAHLRSGHLGGAAVDVYATEPPAADHPLLALEGEAASRLLLTPHIAGVTRQSAAFLFRSAWANIERVLVRGEQPQNRVY